MNAKKNRATIPEARHQFNTIFNKNLRELYNPDIIHPHEAEKWKPTTSQRSLYKVSVPRD